MQNKRAQVAIYVIIGLVLLLSIGLVFYVARYSLNEDTEETTHAKTPTEVYLVTCVEEQLKEAIRFVNLKGGYYYTTAEYLQLAYEGDPIILDIPYYYIDRVKSVPSKEQLEFAIGEYLTAHFEQCLLGLNKEYAYDNTTLKVQVALTQETLKVTLTPRLTIQEEQTSYAIGKLSAETETTMLSAYDAIERLVDLELAAGENFCISCFDDVIQETPAELNLTFSVMEYATLPDFSMIYTAHYLEPGSTIPMDVYFAGVYDLTEEQSVQELAEIPDQSITIGYPFVYQIQTLGAFDQFSDNSDLFEISSSGSINFTPTEKDIGEHLIEITGTNLNSGEEEHRYFYLTILGIGEGPVVEYMGTQIAKVGQLFTYHVIAKDPNNLTLYYTEESALFEINAKSGSISFTPTSSQIGEYEIPITVINQNGLSTQELFSLIITS